MKDMGRTGEPIAVPELCVSTANGTEVRFSRSFQVGRDDDCEVVIDDAHVSRKHVAVSFHADFVDADETHRGRHFQLHQLRTTVDITCRSVAVPLVRALADGRPRPPGRAPPRPRAAAHRLPGRRPTAPGGLPGPRPHLPVPHQRAGRPALPHPLAAPHGPAPRARPRRCLITPRATGRPDRGPGKRSSPRRRVTPSASRLGEDLQHVLARRTQHVARRRHGDRTVLGQRATTRRRASSHAAAVKWIPPPSSTTDPFPHERPHELRAHAELLRRRRRERLRASARPGTAGPRDRARCRRGGRGGARALLDHEVGRRVDRGLDVREVGPQPGRQAAELDARLERVGPVVVDRRGAGPGDERVERGGRGQVVADAAGRRPTATSCSARRPAPARVGAGERDQVGDGEPRVRGQHPRPERRAGAAPAPPRPGRPGRRRAPRRRRRSARRPESRSTMRSPGASGTRARRGARGRSRPVVVERPARPRRARRSRRGP